ncbi:inositol polyphosphate-5-phosphatase A isoform X1 [Tachysurus ichikawai]
MAPSLARSLVCSFICSLLTSFISLGFCSPSINLLRCMVQTLLLAAVWLGPNALGSCYFIHESLKTIHQFDFKAKKFKKVVGKEVYSDTLDSTSMLEKEKFPQDYFPEPLHLMFPHEYFSLLILVLGADLHEPPVMVTSYGHPFIIVSGLELPEEPISSLSY